MLLNTYKKLNITFCGMMGSGKSVIGKKFAKTINFDFIDTDKLIEEKTGKLINEIFNEFGEDYFRTLEEEIISKILNKKNHVFSLGGGVMINKKLRSIIKKNSFNIYLQVEIDTLSKRLASSNNRPLINKKDIKEKLLELMNKRKKFYEQANLIISNKDKVSDTIYELKKYFKIYDKKN